MHATHQNFQVTKPYHQSFILGSTSVYRHIDQQVDEKINDAEKQYQDLGQAVVTHRDRLNQQGRRSPDKKKPSR